MLDTSDIKLVKKFIINEKETDILVLNTGGPTAKGFVDISEADWNKYYCQLFLSFCLILKGLKINKGGYVFLVSSYNVKEPDPRLILSNSFRIAFVSVFKSISKMFASDDISCINIAPGPILTDRFIDLVDDLEEAEKILRSAERAS